MPAACSYLLCPHLDLRVHWATEGMDGSLKGPRHSRTLGQNDIAAACDQALESIWPVRVCLPVSAAVGDDRLHGRGQCLE